MASILVVDDDAQIRELLAQALSRDGHRVAAAACGAEVDEALCARMDLILLDVMMPGEDGFALCARVRRWADCPILFLTARAAEADVVTGLNIGADDYLVKPFRVAELRARVNAHLRREGKAPVRRLVRGDVALDLAGREAFCRGTPVRLTRGEFGICALLATHPGQVFSKEQIYEAVFGYDGEADESAITEHVKNIRGKLRAAEPCPIETVWGVGYRWRRDEKPD